MHAFFPSGLVANALNTLLNTLPRPTSNQYVAAWRWASALVMSRRL
jgi:hypothetical protein